MRAVLVLLLWSAVAEAAPRVVFSGNDNIASRDLLAAMKYPADDQERLDLALLYVSAFYWDRGYANVKVLDAPWSKTEIAIAIEEGPKFTIGSVIVKDHPELLDKVMTRPGTTFSRTQIAEDRETLQTFYEDQGYAFANVLPLTRVDLEHATIDLTFEIDRGKRARFGRFDIYNAPVDLVRSELGVAEGERFNSSRLETARRRLIAAGFTDVVISTKRGRTPELVDVVVELPSRD
jgi:outer membrane protein insertion porin family